MRKKKKNNIKDRVVLIYEIYYNLIHGKKKSKPSKNKNINKPPDFNIPCYHCIHSCNCNDGFEYLRKTAAGTV